MRKIPAGTRNSDEGRCCRRAGAPMRLAYRVDEACALLGVSRDTIEQKREG